MDHFEIGLFLSTPVLNVVDCPGSVDHGDSVLHIFCHGDLPQDLWSSPALLHAAMEHL